MTASTPLAGRVALVTGASSGIGAAIARALIEAGARVHGTARRAEVIADEVGREHVAAGRLTTHALDLADLAGVRQLGRHLAETDPIDILVCAAGTNITDRRFRQLTPEGWEHLRSVNLDSVFHIMHSTMDQLRARGGDIVMISSVAAEWPDHSGSAYGASKAAVLALARGVSRDEHANGIRVTSVLPGIVDTPILDRRPSPPPQDVRDLCVKPEDVAAAVLCAVSLPARANIAEMTIVATRLQSIGNTQQATPQIATPEP